MQLTIIQTVPYLAVYKEALNLLLIPYSAFPVNSETPKSSFQI